MAVGGALGSWLRFGFEQASAGYEAASSGSAADGDLSLRKAFPLGVLVSNLLGCLLMGLLDALLSLSVLPRSRPSLCQHLRCLLLSGLLGSLTTMSSLQLDCALLLQNQRAKEAAPAATASGRQWLGVVNLLASNAGGLLLVLAGRSAGRAATRYWAGKREDRQRARAERLQLEREGSLDRIEAMEPVEPPQPAAERGDGDSSMRIQQSSN